MTETVSVIIPTRNSASTLDKCLNSIKEQTYDKIEVIVVDAHSTDGTQELCRESDEVTLIVSDAGMSDARAIGAEQGNSYNSSQESYQIRKEDKRRPWQSGYK